MPTVVACFSVHPARFAVPPLNPSVEATTEEGTTKKIGVLQEVVAEWELIDFLWSMKIVDGYCWRHL
jgi:hypothetical protein